MNVDVIVNINCDRIKIENKTKQMVRIKSDKYLTNRLLSLINCTNSGQYNSCGFFVRDLRFEWTVSSM